MVLCRWLSRAAKRVQFDPRVLPAARLNLSWFAARMPEAKVLWTTPALRIFDSSYHLPSECETKATLRPNASALSTWLDARYVKQDLLIVTQAMSDCPERDSRRSSDIVALKRNEAFQEIRAYKTASMQAW